MPTAGASGTLASSLINSTGFTVSWTKGTDDISLPVTLQYQVYYSTSNNISIKADVLANGTAFGSYTTDISTKVLTGLSPATLYYFNVLIKDEAGNQAAYQTSSATTLYAAPPNPTAYSGTAFSTTQIDLSWTSGGGSTADYRIAYKAGATAPTNCASDTQISEAAISGAAHSVTGLSAGTQYSFRICAINSNGTPDVSSGLTGSTSTFQAAPPDPTAYSGTAFSTTRIDLSWTSGGGSTADYRIAYKSGATAPSNCASDTQISEAAISGVAHSVTGLSAGTQYSFRICAINSNGTPDVSSGLTGSSSTFQAAPPNPTGYSGTAFSTTRIDLSWTSGGGSTADYRIAYRTGATAPTNCASNTQISESSISGVAHSITGLSAGTQYSFRICAINSNGTPDVSSGLIGSTTTLQAAPPNPTGYSGTAFSTTQINLSWTSGGGSTVDYRIAYKSGATAPSNCASDTQISEASISGVAHSVTGLSVGTQYSFRICAINSNGTPDVSSGLTGSTTTIAGDNFITLDTVSDDIFFGDQVAIHGKTIAVSSTSNDGDAVLSLFEYDPGASDWIKTRKNRSFSSSHKLAISNGIVVSAYDVSGTPNLYYYQFDPSVTPHSSAWIGNSWTLTNGASNNWLSAAAYDNVIAFSGEGAAYGVVDLHVHDPSANTWYLETINSPETTYKFGFDIALEQEILAVGAPSPTAGEDGAVFVYQRNPSTGAWYTGAAHKIVPIDVDPYNDKFGYSVAVSPGRVVVGSPNVDLAYGLALIYQWDEDASTPAWVGAFLPTESHPNGLGTSVAISDDIIAVGAPGTGSDQGKVYVYYYDPSATPPNNWSTHTTIDAPSGALGFGSSVALDGYNLLVGAPRTNSNKGKAYLYSLNPVSSAKTISNALAGDAEAGSITGSNLSIISAAGRDFITPTAASLNIYEYDPSTGIEDYVLTNKQVGSPQEQISSVRSGTRLFVLNENLGSASGNIGFLNLDPDTSTYTGTSNSNRWDNLSSGKINNYTTTHNTGFLQDFRFGFAGNRLALSLYDSSDDLSYLDLWQYNPANQVWTLSNLSSDLDDIQNVQVQGRRVLASSMLPTNQVKLYTLDPSGAYPNWHVTTFSEAGTSSYGKSLAMDGRIIVVGDPTASSSEGRAYVYMFDPSSNTWASTTLSASDKGANDLFASAVRVYDRTVYIGAPGWDSVGTDNKGAIYKYEYDPDDRVWRETIYGNTAGSSGDQLGTFIDGNSLEIRSRVTSSGFDKIRITPTK